jgi:hypothetical protein
MYDLMTYARVFAFQNPVPTGGNIKNIIGVNKVTSKKDVFSLRHENIDISNTAETIKEKTIAPLGRVFTDLAAASKDCNVLNRIVKDSLGRGSSNAVTYDKVLGDIKNQEAKYMFVKTVNGMKNNTPNKVSSFLSSTERKLKADNQSELLSHIWNNHSTYSDHKIAPIPSYIETISVKQSTGNKIKSTLFASKDDHIMFCPDYKISSSGDKNPVSLNGHVGIYNLKEIEQLSENGYVLYPLNDKFNVTENIKECLLNGENKLVQHQVDKVRSFYNGKDTFQINLSGISTPTGGNVKFDDRDPRSTSSSKYPKNLFASESIFNISNIAKTDSDFNNIMMASIPSITLASFLSSNKGSVSFDSFITEGPIFDYDENDYNIKVSNSIVKLKNLLKPVDYIEFKRSFASASSLSDIERSPNIVKNEYFKYIGQDDSNNLILTECGIDIDDPSSFECKNLKDLSTLSRYIKSYILNNPKKLVSYRMYQLISDIESIEFYFNMIVEKITYTIGIELDTFRSTLYSLVEGDVIGSFLLSLVNDAVFAALTLFSKDNPFSIRIKDVITKTLRFAISRCVSKLDVYAGRIFRNTSAMISTVFDSVFWNHNDYFSNLFSVVSLALNIKESGSANPSIGAHILQGSLSDVEKSAGAIDGSISILLEKNIPKIKEVVKSDVVNSNKIKLTLSNVHLVQQVLDLIAHVILPVVTTLNSLESVERKDAYNSAVGAHIRALYKSFGDFLQGHGQLELNFAAFMQLCIDLTYKSPDGNSVVRLTDYDVADYHDILPVSDPVKELIQRMTEKERQYILKSLSLHDMPLNSDGKWRFYLPTVGLLSCPVILDVVHKNRILKSEPSTVAIASYISSILKKMDFEIDAKTNSKFIDSMYEMIAIFTNILTVSLYEGENIPSYIQSQLNTLLNSINMKPNTFYMPLTVHDDQLDSRIFEDKNDVLSLDYLYNSFQCPANCYSPELDPTDSHYVCVETYGSFRSACLPYRMYNRDNILHCVLSNVNSATGQQQNPYNFKENSGQYKLLVLYMVYNIFKEIYTKIENSPAKPVFVEDQLYTGHYIYDPLVFERTVIDPNLARRIDVHSNSNDIAQCRENIREAELFYPCQPNVVTNNIKFADSFLLNWLYSGSLVSNDIIVLDKSIFTIPENAKLFSPKYLYYGCATEELIAFQYANACGMGLSGDDPIDPGEVDAFVINQDALEGAKTRVGVVKAYRDLAEVVFTRALNNDLYLVLDGNLDIYPVLIEYLLTDVATVPNDFLTRIFTNRNLRVTDVHITQYRQVNRAVYDPELLVYARIFLFGYINESIVYINTHPAKDFVYVNNEFLTENTIVYYNHRGVKLDIPHITPFQDSKTMSCIGESKPAVNLPFGEIESGLMIRDHIPDYAIKTQSGYYWGGPFFHVDNKVMVGRFMESVQLRENLPNNIFGLSDCQEQIVNYIKSPKAEFSYFDNIMMSGVTKYSAISCMLLHLASDDSILYHAVFQLVMAGLDDQVPSWTYEYKNTALELAGKNLCKIVSSILYPVSESSFPSKYITCRVYTRLILKSLFSGDYESKSISNAFYSYSENLSLFQNYFYYLKSCDTSTKVDFPVPINNPSLKDYVLNQRVRFYIEDMAPSTLSGCIVTSSCRCISSFCMPFGFAEFALTDALTHPATSNSNAVIRTNNDLIFLPFRVYEYITHTFILNRTLLIDTYRRKFMVTKFVKHFLSIDVEEKDFRYSNMEYFLSYAKHIPNHDVASIYITLCFCRLTKGFLYFLLDNNIPFPFGFIIARPWVTASVNNAIMGAFSGGRVGCFYVGDIDVMYGDDPVIKAHMLHVTGYSTPAIYNSHGLYYIDNISMNQFLCGYTTQFFRRDEIEYSKNEQHLGLQLRDRADPLTHSSMLSIMTLYEDPGLPTTIDLRGRFPDANPTKTRMNFITTKAFFDVTGFATNGQIVHPYYPEQPKVNTVCTVTHFFKQNPSLGTLNMPNLGRCCIGQEQYDGMVNSVLNNVSNINRAVLETMNYHRLIASHNSAVPQM